MNDLSLIDNLGFFARSDYIHFYFWRIRDNLSDFVVLL